MMKNFTEGEKVIIYKCAESLLRLSNTLKDIDDSLSLKTLEISDSVLKLRESEQYDNNLISNLNKENPQPIITTDIENEIKGLVNKIRDSIEKE